jgi:ATP-binding cassette subfamily B protein
LDCQYAGKSVPYASVISSAIDGCATVWFSSQARKAFQIHAFNGFDDTELQETISSVREVQAFSREQENVQISWRLMPLTGTQISGQYRSPVPCTLGRPGYLALAIVTCVGIVLTRPDFVWHLISFGLIVTFLAYNIQPADPANICAVD